MNYAGKDLFLAIEFAAMEANRPLWEVLATWEEKLSSRFRSCCRWKKFVGEFLVQMDVAAFNFGFFMLKRVFADVMDANFEISLADAKSLNNCAELDDKLWIEIEKHFDEPELKKIIIDSFGETLEWICKHPHEVPGLYLSYINLNFVGLTAKEETRKQFVFLGTHRLHPKDARFLYEMGCVFLQGANGPGRWYSLRTKETEACSAYGKARKIFPKLGSVLGHSARFGGDNLADFDEENLE